ncbi:MAG TPA: helix-turn-helix transcriptional regulator [Ktedonobacteraceae bacterium]|nr:helix-turn-helix transcriptional regulator [Ktedonobacteraceae bacterium]
MQEAPHPNKLRKLLAIAGLNQREAAHEAGIPEGTLRHYVAGAQVIPRRDRTKLAQVIGCDVQDLAPLYDAQGARPEELGLRHHMTDQRKPLPILESNGFFSFGKFETALVVLDGNGMETYAPENIHTFYDYRPIRFTEEIEQMRGRIEQEQLQNELDGKPLLWNGENYHLAKYVLSRDSIHEQMKLSLWFHPTDYYTILAKNRCLEDDSFRGKYLSDEGENPLPSLPIPFGIGLSLLTIDGYILFTQRAGDVGVRPGYFMTSVEEGLSRPLDRSTISDAPDVYRCACRGLAEELGFIEKSDFSLSDILFLALGLDTEHYMCGLRGFMKSQKTAKEIMSNWQQGVKDKLENKKLFAIPFTPEDVCAFVFSHGPWGGGALMGIYHTLVHEFGKAHVTIALTAY